MIVCDTGPLVAAAISNDDDHHACVELFTALHLAGRQILIPWSFSMAIYRFGTTDAAVVAVAERLGLPEIATLDRRHFTVVRPLHTPALTLLP